MTKQKSPLRQKDIRTGAQQERERILEVVTSQGCDCNPDCDRIDMSLTQLVALIKGDE
jgi:hypothetical protein